MKIRTNSLLKERSRLALIAFRKEQKTGVLDVDYVINELANMYSYDYDSYIYIYDFLKGGSHV